MTPKIALIIRLLLVPLLCGLSASAAAPRKPEVSRVEGMPPPLVDIHEEEVWMMIVDAVDPPPPQPSDEALAFFKQHAPNRYEMYKRVSGNHPFLRARLLDRMINRYTQLQRRQADDPELYASILKQLELQDQSLPLIDSQPNPKENDQLRKNVGEIVDLNIQERQRRIDRLEKTLAELKSRLEDDKGNRNGLIDRQIDQLVRDAKNYSAGLDQLKKAPAPATPSK